MLRGNVVYLNFYKIVNISTPIVFVYLCSVCMCVHVYECLCFIGNSPLVLTNVPQYPTQHHVRIKPDGCDPKKTTNEDVFFKIQ